jgi:1-acyl-sn-glycerol-3-phosphate acyltransferase
MRIQRSLGRGWHEAMRPRPFGRLLTGIRSQLSRLVIVVALAIMLPLVVLAEKLRGGRGRALARRCIRGTSRLCGITFDVQMAEGLALPPSPVIYTPNHSSLLDVPAMLIGCPTLRFIGAADLFRIPLLGAAMRALHTVPIDRRHPTVARQQLAELVESRNDQRRNESEGDDLVIFPEGAIAATGRHLPFKSGAFVLAIETRTPVVPVAIHHAGEVAPPGRFLAVRPGHIVIELLQPIETTGLSYEDRGELRDRVQSAVRSALEAGPARDRIACG